MANGMELGTTGVAGLATEAAIGVGIAREIGQIPAQNASADSQFPTARDAAARSGNNRSGTAHRRAADLCRPLRSRATRGSAASLSLLSPAQAAELLGVGEADVIAQP